MKDFPRPVLALAIVGSLLSIAGIAADGRVDASDLRSVGIGVALAALGWLALHKQATRRVDPSVEIAYELGVSDGYRGGFEAGVTEGRRLGRAIVPLGQRCCGSCKRGSDNVVPLATESTLAHNAASHPFAGPGGSVESPAWEDSAANGLVSPK